MMTTLAQDDDHPLAPPRGMQVLPPPPSPSPSPSFLDALNPAKQSSSSTPSFVLPVVTLRKVTARKLFENVDDSCWELRAPIQRLRLIDSLRYHTPTQQEREEFNIQAAKERLFLHTLSDLLIVCGARRGFRFASEQINQLVAQGDRLKHAYEVTNALFAKLPTDMLQFRFPKEVRRVDQAQPFYNHLLELRKQQPNKPAPDVQNCVEEALAIVLNTNLDIHVRALVFHQQVNEYVSHFVTLRDLVLQIRQRVAVQRPIEPTTGAMQSIVNGGKEPVIESEMETKGASHPFPKFLVVLLDKYRRETTSTTGSNKSKNDFPMESIAHFAVFLAEMFLHPTPCTTTELQSAVEFLEVLKVEYHVDSHVNQIELQQLPRRWTNGGLSWEIFEFLATVREFRSVPQKKELLRPRSNSNSPVRTHTKQL